MKKRLILTAVLILVVLVGSSSLTLAGSGGPTTQRDLDEFFYFGGVRIKMPYHWLSDDGGLRLIPYYDTQMLWEMYACPHDVVTCWLIALESYQADPTRDQTEMWGTITERPLDDGTALVHANLHYRNLDFVILDQYDMPVVIDGEMEATLNWQFIIPYPGAPLSYFTEETVSTHLNTRGEGFLTGGGGFDPGPARVKVNMVGLHFGEDTPQNPNTYCWGDYCEMWPVETIRITPTNN